MATTVVTNQLGCQLEPKILHHHAGTARGMVLHEDEGIGDGDIEQEIKDVLIEFPALCPAVVVTPCPLLPYRYSRV